VPRIGPHVALMRERLSAALGLPEDAVSIKATTTDHLGALGQAERGAESFAHEGNVRPDPWLLRDDGRVNVAQPPAFGSQCCHHGPKHLQAVGTGPALV